MSQDTWTDDPFCPHCHTQCDGLDIDLDPDYSSGGDFTCPACQHRFRLEWRMVPEYQSLEIDWAERDRWVEERKKRDEESRLADERRQNDPAFKAAKQAELVRRISNSGMMRLLADDMMPPICPHNLMGRDRS